MPALSVLAAKSNATKAIRVPTAANKAQPQCLYEVPATHRPRKRAAEEDLLARLAQYANLMRKHNVEFSHYANT